GFFPLANDEGDADGSDCVDDADAPRRSAGRHSGGLALPRLESVELSVRNRDPGRRRARNHGLGKASSEPLFFSIRNSSEKAAHGRGRRRVMKNIVYVTA